MLNRLEEFNVLVTGGTRGIGLACVQRFLECGARVFTTYNWGGEVEAAEQKFASHQERFHLIQADVGQERDTEALMREIGTRTDKLDVFISNVAVASQFKGRYVLKDLHSSMQYTTWPLVAYLERIEASLGNPPSYAIALTSLGTITYCEAYDYVGACKAALELLVKNIAARSELKINCVMPSFADTESFDEIFDTDFKTFLKTHAPEMWVSPEEVAGVIYALCSGSMDAVSGQVITVDHGQAFADNAFKWYQIFQKLSEDNKQ